MSKKKDSNTKHVVNTSNDNNGAEEVFDKYIDSETDETGHYQGRVPGNVKGSVRQRSMKDDNHKNIGKIIKSTQSTGPRKGVK